MKCYVREKPSTLPSTFQNVSLNCTSVFQLRQNYDRHRALPTNRNTCTSTLPDELFSFKKSYALTHCLLTMTIVISQFARRWVVISSWFWKYHLRWTNILSRGGLKRSSDETCISMGNEALFIVCCLKPKNTLCHISLSSYFVSFSSAYSCPLSTCRRVVLKAMS